MTQLRVVLIRVALLFSSVILAFVLAEGVLHLLVPASSGDLFTFTPQSMRYKVMKPNNRAIVYGIPFQTNDLGFRDQTGGLPAKVLGEKRIIVLGDSYTASAGVPFESIYTEISERELARLSESPKIKVMNLATGGYNILQFWYTLTESGLSLSPDYVVVGILVVEDFDRMGLYQEARRIAMGGASSKPRWVDTLYLTRAFGRYVQRIYNLVIGPRRSNRTAPGAHGAPPYERHINEQALLDIQDALTQRHIPLLVILLPENYNFSKQQSAHSEAADFCRSHSIDFIDTLPSFISDGHRPGYFGLNIIDRHPNARYNQLVGTELAKALASRLAGQPRQGRVQDDSFFRRLQGRNMPFMGHNTSLAGESR